MTTKRMQTLVWSAVAMLAGMTAGGCAHTGVNSTEGWNKVQTKHFTVHTPMSQRYEEALNIMEYIYSGLVSSFFRDADTGPIDVMMLERDDFVELFGNRRFHMSLARTPGGTKIGAKGLVFAVVSTSGEEHTEAIAHQLIQRAFPKAPLWFHEGFSSWLRTGQFLKGNGKQTACYGKPGLTEISFIPLEKLFEIDWDAYDGPEARSWYKHTARMLFDFTMFGEKSKHMPQIEKIVDGVAEGRSGPSIIAEAFPELSTRELNKRVMAHGRDVLHAQFAPHGLCPIGFPILGSCRGNESARSLSARMGWLRASSELPMLDRQARREGDGSRLGSLRLRSDGFIKPP